MATTKPVFTLAGAGNRSRGPRALDVRDAARCAHQHAETARQHTDTALALMADACDRRDPTLRVAVRTARIVHGALLALDGGPVRSHGEWLNVPPPAIGASETGELPHDVHVRIVDYLIAAHAEAWLTSHVAALALTRRSPAVRWWVRSTSALAALIEEVRLTRSLVANDRLGASVFEELRAEGVL